MDKYRAYPKQSNKYHGPRRRTKESKDQPKSIKICKLFQHKLVLFCQHIFPFFCVFPFPPDNITRGSVSARAKYPLRPILLWPGHKPVPRRQRDQLLAGESSAISSHMHSGQSRWQQDFTIIRESAYQCLLLTKAHLSRWVVWLAKILTAVCQ